MLPFKIISQFHIDICSKTLWVNTERGAREKILWTDPPNSSQMPPGEAGQFGHWRNVSWLLKHEQSNSLGLCRCVSQRITLWGGAACTVYFVFLTNIQQLCWYFLVIQCCRKSGKYTPPSQKKKCAPFENKVQAFIFYLISHIYYYLWFSSPLCLWLEAYAVRLRGSLNWNWTYRHHTDVEKNVKACNNLRSQISDDINSTWTFLHTGLHTVCHQLL